MRRASTFTPRRAQRRGIPSHAWPLGFGRSTSPGMGHLMLTIKDRLVDAALDDPKIYTMRELNQRTAQVLEEINDNKRPAAITKHGRFVALVLPLRDAEIE